MKTLTLRNSNLCALVDDEDYERLASYTWYVASKRSLSIKHITKDHKNVALASVVMQQLDAMYDHIDRNTLNNQKSNLRLITYLQNGFNRTKCKRITTSRYKGVHWSKQMNKWAASIRFKGRLKHLGFHLKEIDAALAYNKAATELFGEFACLNVI